VTGSLALLAAGLFVAFVGHVGAHLLPRGRTSASVERDGVATASGLEAAALRFLLGFGLVSLGLFGLVYLDCFAGWGLGIAMAAPIGLGLAMRLRAPAALPSSLMGRDLAVGLLLALLALGFGWLSPAYDLTLAGSDGSVYLAAAHQLAAGGHLQYRDELVAEATADERTVLFERTSDGRLPGGIPLLDPAAGRVSFSFYHLLPAWLAFGLRTMGRDGDLRVWSLFPVVSLCSSFLLGRRLGGKALGLALCLVQLCFLPQAFFVRFPSSEILAQALFLAGLAFLAARLGRGAPVRLEDAAAAGVLWGALCLSRVDSIPFLWMGLTLAAFGCRRGFLAANAWFVSMAWIVACSSLALHYQFSNNSYMHLPSMAFLRGQVARAVPGLVSEPWGRVAVLSIAVTIVAAAHRDGRGEAETLRLFRIVRVLCALPAAAILAHFGSQWHWVAVAGHLEWMAWYATTGGLAALAAGLAFGSLRWLRSTAEPGPRLALALLVGPAFCYLVNPMVTRTQPWAVRRFVPMIFPLFLLLSLLGWRALAVWLWRDRPRLAALTQAGIFIGIAATLHAQSARVVLPGVAAPVRETLRALARTIPEHALVLVSDADAGLHLQTAFQYVLRRETLLLPLAAGSEPRKDALVLGYLRRQMARGRRLVLVLAQDDTRAGSLPRAFGLSLRSTALVEYLRMPFTRKDRFPPKVKVGRLWCRVYELQPVARVASWRDIRIGDPDHDAAVVMEGFHAAEREDGEEGERPYRWTGPVARLSLPPVAEAWLLLDTWRPPSAPPGQVEVDVDGVRVEGVRDRRQGRWWLRLRLPKEPVAANRIVTLRANTFTMNAPGTSSDARQLGVRVFAVSIGRSDSGTSATPAAPDERRPSVQGPPEDDHAAGDAPGRRSGRARNETKAIQ
jgi:hypothetical protein